MPESVRRDGMSLDSTFLLRSDGRSRYGGRYGGDMADCGETGQKTSLSAVWSALSTYIHEARRADLRSRCERKKFRGRGRKTSGEAEKEK